MIIQSKRSQRGWLKFAMAGAAVAAISILSTGAFANGCPAGNLVADGQGQKAGATMPVGVTDTVLESIDLSKQKVALKDHLFRIRRLVIQPGGVVPWHSHADRPALIYIVQGEITEYASDCAVPILHRAGDWSRDADISHWWKNTGKKVVVLISADILDNGTDAHTM
ncbi:MAG TPA: cupin domain-containing protein [Candidatus Udaeobacter sp.]|nr:cupin domain-containing protein [Candidatus Udaeobacter sp.]